MHWQGQNATWSIASADRVLGGLGLSWFEVFRAEGLGV